MNQQVATLPTRLNLGCGSFKKPGFLNVDMVPEVEPELILDLDSLPYPFPDNHFELIEAFHVLEHLRDPFQAIAEMYRIAKPGAQIHIRVPHFSRGFTHPDHKHGFSVNFPTYYANPSAGLYRGVHLKLLKMRLRWLGQPYLKKSTFSKPLFLTASAIGGVIDFFANLSPYLASRLWCYWVGGFEEVEYRF
jgi:predicted SAM-dependent methyltransferase